ncbi:GGDEF domain-containing protein [Caproiciproducens sp. R2]|uniref:GGDEF domain-containing protein n=1 Tax=Caproiciproducens sp. R2 TaxID=3435187 RepID=UPI004033D420
MTEKITLDKLQANLDFFHKMYDAVRLVDPVRKRVMEYRNNGTAETCEACYAYWSSGRICENCVSIRAHREQKSFMKLEHSPDAIMLVTALPIDSEERPVVLEILKNATDTMMIGTGEYNKGQVLFNAVRDINDMVIRDELTSLYNRRFLDDRLPADIVGAMVGQKPLSVIFIDIDNMKTVNDTFGHAAGDQVLKFAAGTIQKCIRNETDWAARYGGDEFVICLNNTGSEEAHRVSQRIYQDFDKAAFPIQGSDIGITVSQGVVTMPDSGLTAEEIIKLADKKMYEAKKRHKRTER